MNHQEQIQVELEALQNALAMLNEMQVAVLDRVISSLTDKQLESLKEYSFMQSDGTETIVVKVNKQGKTFVCVPSYEITNTIDDVNPELHFHLSYNTVDIDTLQVTMLIEYIIFNIVK